MVATDIMCTWHMEAPTLDIPTIRTWLPPMTMVLRLGKPEICVLFTTRLKERHGLLVAFRRSLKTVRMLLQHTKILHPTQLLLRLVKVPWEQLPFWIIQKNQLNTFVFVTPNFLK